jgi:hypothetical protein
MITYGRSMVGKVMEYALKSIYLMGILANHITGFVTRQKNISYRFLP